MLIVLSLFLLSISSVVSRVIIGRYAGYQLDDMAMCELGWPMSEYNHYGCACSDLIRLAAVDQVDQCCERHNECYDSARSECGTLSPYYAFYSYKCESKKITCKDSIHSCAGYVCNCDKTFLDCLQKFPKPVEPVPKCKLTFYSSASHNKTSNE